MFNAKPFFEECAFIPWEQQKTVRAVCSLFALVVFASAGPQSLRQLPTQAGVRKEAVLEIKRRCGRAKPVVYHVIDKPPAKKSSVRPWPRLVSPPPVVPLTNGPAHAGVGAGRRGVCSGRDVAVPGFPV